VSEATPFARTVVLDEIARQALDYICEHWEGGNLRGWLSNGSWRARKKWGGF
jgi:hypothetical protein